MSRRLIKECKALFLKCTTSSWHKIRWNRLILLSPLFVLAVWYAYPNWALHELLPIVLKMDDSDWAVRGQIGDSFGAFNALFSGLGIAGLAINIYMQGVQIKKLEVKEQQNEDQLAAQAEALRLTALLNYYTSEFGRLTSHIRDGNELAKNAPEEQKKEALDFIEELYSERLTISIKRNDIVERLEKIEFR